jgi:hypothetical protein
MVDEEGIFRKELTLPMLYLEKQQQEFLIATVVVVLSARNHFICSHMLTPNLAFFGKCQKFHPKSTFNNFIPSNRIKRRFQSSQIS